MRLRRSLLLQGVGAVLAAALTMSFCAQERILRADENTAATTTNATTTTATTTTATTTTTTGTTAVTEPLQEVHTIYWKAKVTAKVRSTDLNTGEAVKIGKNTPVTVIERKYSNKRSATGKSLCTYEDYKFYVDNRYLKFIADACTADTEGDYNTTSKEYFINKVRQLSSRTDRLIWICLDKQRVNVFTGAMGNWKLEETFLCSTGAATSPTAVRVDVVNFKKERYRIEGSSVKYFVEAIGSGFHMWNYSGKFKARVGRHTISHGCIRLKKEDAIWMFENIEVGTRVLIF